VPVSRTQQFRAILTEAESDHDVLTQTASLCHLGHTLAWLGDTAGALAAATAAVEAAAEFGGVLEGLAYSPLAVASLAAGDVAAAAAASAVATDRLSAQPGLRVVSIVNPTADIALARGEVTEARRRADEGVAVAVGGGMAMALTTRTRVAVAQGESEQAERDAREALAVAAAVDAHLATPDALECLAGVVGAAGSHREAAQLYGAADAVRQATGIVRFKVYDDGYVASVNDIRDALGHNDFDAAWAEGAALSTLEAIAYARRGHSDRKRPTSEWDALTPTEHDVVRLVTEGLANKDIVARLFVSPRTVQSHLTHIYNKLDVSSRVQLVQQAARHS
jgi:DNA-binding CsgD family transcriptional regulator